MATRIIILERTPAPQMTFRYAFWAAVPVARQAFYADASKKSAWKDAQASDLTALQNGSVVERIGEISVPPGTTIAQIEAQLEALWNRFQNDINGANDWSRYGSTWDGTTWTLQGV